MNSCVALGLTLVVSACATAKERRALALYRAPMPTAVDSDSDRSAPSQALDIGRDQPVAGSGSGSIRSFGELVAHIGAHHPTLRAAWHRARAHALGAPATRRLANPTVSLTAFLSSAETRVGPQHFAVGVQQRLPWPGKLDERANVKFARADVERRVLDAAFVAMVRDIRHVWLARGRAQERAALFDAQRQTAEHLRNVIKARVALGRSTLAEHTRASLRVESLRDRAELERERSQEFAASLLGMAALPQSTTLPPAALPSHAADAPPVQAPSFEYHPTHRVALAQREVARATRAAAADANMPDVTFGAKWTYVSDALVPTPDSGKDVVTVSVGLSLPIWNDTYQADVDAAEASALAATSAADAVIASAKGAYHRLRKRYVSAQRRRKLHGDTLKAVAANALTAAIATYSTGEGRLDNIFGLEVALLDHSLHDVDARHDLAAVAAELDALIGTWMRDPAASTSATTNSAKSSGVTP